MSQATTSDDLLSAEAISDPYAYFGHLREVDPVHWNERHGSWVITRYAEVSACFRDSRISSDRVNPHFDERGDEANESWLELVRRVLAGWMVFKDPPEHTRLRGAVHRAFTPKTVRQLQPRVQLIIDELLNAWPSRGEVDFVKEFAFPLPAIVIAEMLGVPPSDRELFKQLSDDLHPLVFGGLSVPDRHERAGRALMRLADYMRDLLAHFRHRPADNLMSGLASRIATGDLTEDEVVANCVLLLFGGHETTTNLLANGLRALLLNADQLAGLRERPDVMPLAVDELLRYDGPAKLSVRWVAEDLDLAGQQIRAGQRTLLVQAAANRDPAVFDRPNDLILDRATNPHLAFGVGPHYCLGAPLARLEAQLAFAELLRRYPKARLADGELEWHRTLLIRGPKALPLHTGSQQTT